MLVISRKVGESVTVSDNIQISVISVDGARVRLGIKAPKNVRILRAELDQSTIAANSAAVVNIAEGKSTLLEEAAASARINKPAAHK